MEAVEAVVAAAIFLWPFCSTLGSKTLGASEGVEAEAA